MITAQFPRSSVKWAWQRKGYLNWQNFLYQISKMLGPIQNCRIKWVWQSEKATFKHQANSSKLIKLQETSNSRCQKCNCMTYMHLKWHHSKLPSVNSLRTFCRESFFFFYILYTYLNDIVPLVNSMESDPRTLSALLPQRVDVAR